MLIVFVFLNHLYKSWGSSVNIVTGLRDRDPILGKAWSILFATASKPGLNSTQPPVQSVPGALTLVQGVELTVYLYLMPRLRMHGVIPPLPHTSSWRGD